MVVLFLGSRDSQILRWLTGQGEIVIQATSPIAPVFIDQNNVDFLVGYGYRHILGKDVLDRLPSQAVNLHIAYLPWNRGADPNLWSFIENTPKGITIHYLDEGIDTGDIIVQQQVVFGTEGETLATTYRQLQFEIQELFKKHWAQIKAGVCPRTKQSGRGTFHMAKDKDIMAHLLIDGWDTSIEKLGR